jgi:O-antigen/teichoic acid export membrane protein
VRALLGAAAFTTISTAITLLVSVARTKVVAVVLGVSGVGLIGQINTALQFAASLVAVGFATATVRRIAVGASGDEDSASSLLATAYLVILVFAAPLIAVLLIGPDGATSRILGEQSPPLARIALAVAVPLVAITNIESAIVRGLKNVRVLTIATSAAAVLGLGLLAPLVLLFGLNGALVHIALFALLTYALSYVARRRAAWQAGFHITLASLPTWRSFQVLLSYGSANAVAGVLNTATLLLVRSYLIETLGLEANGIYQVLLGIPSQTLIVVLNTLSAYAFPVVSGMRERADVNGALNMALRFTLLSSTPIILGLVLFAAPLIRLLYSSEFLPASVFLPLQVLGDFFKMVAWAVGLSLLGRGHLVAFTLLDTVWNVVFAVGVLFLVPRVGLLGAAASYAVAYAIHATATYTYQYRREQFRLHSRNLRLLAASAVLLVGAVGAAQFGQFALQVVYTAVGLGVWIYRGTERTEWMMVWQTASSRLPLKLAKLGR